MSKIIRVSSAWPGFSNLSYLIIFGDSYSSIGFDLFHDTCKPIAEQPLGVPFPGYTWNEVDLPNWVGHLLTEYVPRPRFISGSNATQDPEYLMSPLLVYDYAVGGDTIDGVHRQICRFLSGVGQKPQWAHWSSDNALFTTWVGINDCAHSKEHKENIARLFKLQEQLYETGARNFLFINVPPVNRCPAVPVRQADSVAENLGKYNLELEEAACDFATRHPDITMLLYSSAATFNRILDAPEEYGFTHLDCHRAGGAIWHDMIHPTSRVHNYIARDLSLFLVNVE